VPEAVVQGRLRPETRIPGKLGPMILTIPGLRRPFRLRVRRGLIGMSAACLLALLLPASPASAVGAIEQLRAFAESTRSATGEFTQQLQRKSRQAAPVSRGEFAFARPGRFRWEIREPYEQLIVTDGKKLYFYDKDLKQVTIRAAGDVIRATPAAVLFGGSDIGEAFRLEEKGERDGLHWVEASPKLPDSGFERIRVGLRDGLPLEMEVTDAFGQLSRFTFTRISRNAAVPDDAFNFTPPPGVDVIE
jgi:outer membrane lipoprotein carrier protein